MKSIGLEYFNNNYILKRTLFQEQRPWSGVQFFFRIMKEQFFMLSGEALDIWLFRMTREECEEYHNWLVEATKTGNYNHTFSTDLLNEFHELTLVK